MADGPGDVSSSSEMSFDMSGVGMGRKPEKSPRASFQLGDFLPKPLRSPKSKQTPQVNGFRSTGDIDPSTGTIWMAAIRDPEGSVVLGSWNNSHPYFGRVTKFKSFDESSVSIVKDLKFSGCNKLVNLSPNSFAAGFISGTVVLWDYNLTENEDTMLPFYRHYGKVTGMEKSSDGKFLLTCGRDKKISLIAIEAGVLKDEIREGHIDGIHDISPTPEDDGCVLTCGDDEEISLWDWRIKEGRREAANAQVTNIPTAIHWSTVNTKLFYVGLSNGTVVSYDIRKFNEPLMERHVSPKCRITRIKPLEENKLVIVSERNMFEVLQEGTLITTYTSNPTQGVVHDIVQVNESTVYSVGYGRGFTKHNVVHSSQTQTDQESDEEMNGN